MPKRLKKEARPRDVNRLAHHIVRLTTGADDEPEPEPMLASTEPSASAVSEYMAWIGRRGGVVSGSRRKANLSPELRREIASKAARARWAKRKAAKKR